MEKFFVEDFGIIADLILRKPLKENKFMKKGGSKSCKMVGKLGRKLKNEEKHNAWGENS